VAELPDPMLPVAWTAPDSSNDDAATHAVVDTVLNVLVIAFLIWLTVIMTRGSKSERDEPSPGDAPANS